MKYSFKTKPKGFKNIGVRYVWHLGTLHVHVSYDVTRPNWGVDHFFMFSGKKAQNVSVYFFQKFPNGKPNSDLSIQFIAENDKEKRLMSKSFTVCQSCSYIGAHIYMTPSSYQYTKLKKADRVENASS